MAALELCVISSENCLLDVGLPVKSCMFNEGVVKSSSSLSGEKLEAFRLTYWWEVIYERGSVG